MDYTAERQNSDRSFLVGVNYGRASERARLREFMKSLPEGRSSTQLAVLREFLED